MQSVSSWVSGFWNSQPSVPEQLQSALYYGSADQAIQLLKEDPALIGKPLPNGEQPLNYAIRFGRKNVVDYILKNDPVTLDSTDYHGLNPIDHAILSNNSEMVELALATKLNIAPSHSQLVQQVRDRANADLYLKEKRLANIFVETVAKYCTPPSDLQGLFEAASKGDLSSLSEQVQTAADANAVTTDGWSLLHLAAHSGNAELVLFLLNKGAIPNVTTSNRVSPLHIAAIGSNRHVLQHLCNNGANLTATDQEGSTPMHYAATNPELFSVQYLIERKVNLFTHNDNNYSPFQLILALTYQRTNEKDCLKAGDYQLLNFAGVFASLLLPYVDLSSNNEDERKLAVSLYFLVFLGHLSSHITAFPSNKHLLEKATYIATSLLNYLPYNFNYLPYNFFPVLNIFSSAASIINNAWRTYAIGTTALAALKNYWEYRHIETVRPLCNLAVRFTNSLFAVKLLTDATTTVYSATRSLIDSAQKYWEVDPGKYVCKNLPTENDAASCISNFNKNERERFNKEGWYTLPLTLSAEICGTENKGSLENLKTCIGESTKKPASYFSILGLSGLVSSKEETKAYRVATQKFHPDRTGGYRETFEFIKNNHKKCQKAFADPENYGYLRSCDP